MEQDLERLRAPLDAMMRWFSAAGVRAAIIGGVAASLLGKPRLTNDIDAVVLDAEPEALLETKIFEILTGTKTPARKRDSIGAPQPAKTA